MDFPILGVHYTITEEAGEYFWEGIGAYDDQYSSGWDSTLEEAIIDAEIWLVELEEKEEEE